MAVTTDEGVLSTGTRYRIDVPSGGNETLLLYSRPIPVGSDDPPWPDDDPIVADLVGRGYAVAGTANTIFWPLEQAVANAPALVELAGAHTTVRRVIPFGLSIGGLIAAAISAAYPSMVAGSLPMCGNLAGAVAVHNRELDIAFVIATLLGPSEALELVRISDPDRNLERARAVLEEARTNPAGRARLSLAAAVGRIPGWHADSDPEPDPSDDEARVLNQIAWYDEVGFLVYFWAREQVERQAGGNPSWNEGVRYDELLEEAPERGLVERLYAAASLSLADDLARLAAAPRVTANPSAVDYLEQNVVFDGNLHGIPTLTLHTDGDGLVTPDNEQAFAEVVHAAGSGDELRQLWVHRGGHCSFTMAELLTALEALVTRIDDGTWPTLDPDRLNGTALRHGTAANVLRTGTAATPGFFDYRPAAFPRPHDARHARRRSEQVGTV